MSGFAGPSGSGGGGGGACAAYGVSGNVEVASQAQVDQRVAVGVLCPLFIGPAQNRLKVITVGSGIQLLNQVGAYPNDAGSRAIDWQAWRTAITQIASAYYSTAVGQSNTVDSTNSLAVGYHNTVFAGYTRAVAIGSENEISANEAVAVGYNNTVSAGSDGAVAIGRGIFIGAGFLDVVAIGNGAGVNGNNGVAIGTSAAANVAAVAIGNVASAYISATAVGDTAVAAATYSIAVGRNASILAGAANAVAIGYGASVPVVAPSAMALGDRAVNRITLTHNISGPSLIRKDDGELLANALQFFSGDNFYILTPEIDFLAAPADYDIAVPAGASFWVEEVGFILTTLDIPGNVATQPTVRFGITGTPAKWLAPTLCTLLDALRKRERFTLLLTDDGETSMSAGVTVSGALTVPGTYMGRAFFRGMLVEDE